MFSDTDEEEVPDSPYEESVPNFQLASLVTDNPTPPPGEGFTVHFQMEKNDTETSPKEVSVLIISGRIVAPVYSSFLHDHNY